MATDERRQRENRSAEMSSRSGGAPARRDDWSAFWDDPFLSFWRGESPARRFARDMFQDVRRRPGQAPGDRLVDWAPDVETIQRGDEFVVRADLPGMKREDVKLRVTDDALTIEGERRWEHEERREAYVRSERSYGSFCRVVPLPDGAIPDSARASFKDGVLEVVIQAPPKEVSRGRRLEISETEP
jgi:HSP20 family protein